jgi:hypothetical protein
MLMKVSNGVGREQPVVPDTDQDDSQPSNNGSPLHSPWQQPWHCHVAKKQLHAKLVVSFVLTRRELMAQSLMLDLRVQRCLSLSGEAYPGLAAKGIGNTQHSGAFFNGVRCYYRPAIQERSARHLFDSVEKMVVVPICCWRTGTAVNSSLLTRPRTVCDT